MAEQIEQVFTPDQTPAADWKIDPTCVPQNRCGSAPLAVSITPAIRQSARRRRGAEARITAGDDRQCPREPLGLVDLERAAEIPVGTLPLG
jgi:hypothetical protein